MLFRRAELEAIERGEVAAAFRRWRRPRVRPGTRLRTGVGVLTVLSVERVDPEALTEADARAAGINSLAVLLHFLEVRREGEVYRIGLEHAGPDPRLALREHDRLTPAELAAMLADLAGMDRSSDGIGWPLTYLELIERSPGERAAVLAEGIGLETQAFKRRVRRLKELGLTESLRPGYRLSPRGHTALAAIRQKRTPGPSAQRPGEDAAVSGREA